jgi:hypothetical protein
MHLMVSVWLIFAALLFAVQPLTIRHARREGRQAPSRAALTRLLWMHRVLLADIVTATVCDALRAKARHESCRCDRISPLCSRFGSEDPQHRSGDEMALDIEGIENGTVHAEKALSRSS